MNCPPDPSSLAQSEIGILMVGVADDCYVRKCRETQHRTLTFRKF